MSDQAILSHRTDTTQLPATGMDVEIKASDAQRAALATAYGLAAVERLTASTTLTPAADGLVTVTGQVMADIVQSCVVSLEPVPQHIDEGFSVDFVPADSPRARPPAGAGKEVAIDPDAPDPPEVMDGTVIDVGALAEEMFVLAIDPYPRAPGAELPAESGAEPPSGDESPFAVLREVMRTRK